LEQKSNMGAVESVPTAGEVKINGCAKSEEAGNNTIFTPIVMSACGAMGPSVVAFLKEVYTAEQRALTSSSCHSSRH
jgi:hypothetical protein